MSGLMRSTPPAVEPVALIDAKAHCRISTSDDDALVMGLITAARLLCEEWTRRALVTQGFRLWLDGFPGGEPNAWWDGVREGAPLTVTRSLRLPRAPLQAVNAVTIYDDNNQATLCDPALFFTDTASEPGRLALRANASWPLPGRARNGVSIDFTAGYGEASAVPQPLKQGILAHVAQLYEARGDGFGSNGRLNAAPELSLALYSPYRLQGLAGGLA